MNESNLNEEKNGLPQSDSYSSDALTGEAEVKDGFSDSPAAKEPEAAFKAPEYPAYKADTPVQPSVPNQPITPAQPSIPVQSNIPVQPNTPVQSNIPVQPTAPVQQRPPYPTQNGYRPMQNNQPQAQPPRQPYNPYVNPQANMAQGYQHPYQHTHYNPAPQNLPPETSQRGGKNLAIILIAICAAVAVICIAFGMLNGNSTAETAASETTTTQSSSSTTNSSASTVPGTTVNTSVNVSTTSPSSEVPNSVYVAQKVRPSVVGVMTYKNGKLAGEGSGVLMSEFDGWTYIITCAHVINESGIEYGILFLDGTHLEAELVAYDNRTDIGVVKVNKTGLPLAEFGDSTTLQVGEPIYAVGNPGGSEYFGSITDGIIASIDRSITSTYTMTCIQHNAAINPGNSGGALVNSSGQIIGINSAKIASTEFEGMGFAVPTSIAIHVADSLINYGYVQNRTKIGIEYAPITSYQIYSIIASIHGLPQGSVVVASISDESTINGTEVKVGDLIIGVNGKEMSTTNVLLDTIDKGSVGDKITLNMCRIDSRSYKITKYDVEITLIEDRG